MNMVLCKNIHIVLNSSTLEGAMHQDPYGQKNDCNTCNTYQIPKHGTCQP